MVQHLYLRLKTSEQSQTFDTMENNSVKVEGHSDLRKDIFSGAVVNNDRTAYERYLQSKKNFEKMHSTVEDINTLKEEMSEIKTLLKELLKRES